jgi:hypothetical protein
MVTAKVTEHVGYRLRNGYNKFRTPRQIDDLLTSAKMKTTTLKK